MKNQMRRDAAKMLKRAQALGLTTKDGKPLVVDQIEELLAAREGFRNAHAYRAALDTRETPALVQEKPDQTGSDYKLVSGQGVWLTMGVFSVHPYFTDEGIVVDIYGKNAEEESIASTYAFTTEAEGDIEEEASEGSRPLDAISLGTKREVLETLGYEIEPDSDQPGLWVWTTPTDSCDWSFHTEEEATFAAWSDAAGQAQAANQLSDEQWNALSFAEQRKLLEALGNS